jgi:hypothetical protein
VITGLSTWLAERTLVAEVIGYLRRGNEAGAEAA